MLWLAADIENRLNFRLTERYISPENIHQFMCGTILGQLLLWNMTDDFENKKIKSFLFDWGAYIPLMSVLVFTKRM